VGIKTQILKMMLFSEATFYCIHMLMTKFPVWEVLDPMILVVAGSSQVLPVEVIFVG
jgi:hypothetical protein